MKNFKKVVAAGLALLMLALSVNVTFAAESYTDKEAVVVAKVNAAGIMTGTDKGFEPSKTLTRAEAAAIFVRMKNISEATVKQNAGTTLFTDVAASHWAAGYVNVASNYGIIKGVGANKFAPEKEVTVAEFYTMAVRALNAGQLVEAEGTWPTNYVNFAIENDLAEDVAQLYSLPATRMTAATIVANTLKANMWDKAAYVNNGEITFTKGDKNILNDVLKIYELEERTISVTDSKKNKGTVSGSAPSTYPSIPTEFNEKTANLGSAKAGQKYTVWYNKDEVLGFWVKEDSKKVVFTDIKDAVAQSATKVTFVVDGEEKDYDIKSDATIELNGDVAASIAAPTGAAFNVFGTMYLDNDGKVTAVYAEQYNKYCVVKEIKNDRIYVNDDVVGDTQTSTLALALKDTDKTVYKVSKNGKGIDITDIEEGDAIFFYKDDDDDSDTFETFVIEVLNDTVEGKVTAVSGSDKVTIDGTSYKLKGINNTGLLKTEGTFYLNAEGKIVMYIADEVTTDYAIISSIKYVNNGVVGENEYQIKLGYTDGTVSDWLQIHKDNAADGHVTLNVTDANTDNHYDILGTLVKYELKAGKAILTPVTPTNVTSLVLNKNNEIELKNAGDSAYLNKSSVVVELQSNDEEKYDEEIKLLVLAAEDLDAMSASDIETPGDVYFVKNADHADEADILVFLEDKSTVKADKTWAFVIDEDANYRETENEDLVYKYDVVFAGESKATTLYAKSGIGSLKGNVVELGLDDNIIKSKKIIASAAKEVTDKFLYATESDYITTAEVKDNAQSPAVIDKNDFTSTIGSIKESGRHYLADDAIVIMIDTTDSNKFKVSALSDIDALSDKVGDTVTEGTDFVKEIYFDTNADDEKVVVAIVYYMYE